MSEPLQSIPEVARQTGASREQVRTALKHAGIEPAQSMKMGSKVVSLYSPAPAAKAVADYQAELERVRAARTAAPEPEQDIDFEVPSLSAIVEAVAEVIHRDATARDQTLASIDDIAASTSDVIEQLVDMVKKLHEQNVILFRALKDMETAHTGRLVRLQNTLTGGAPESPPAPPPQRTPSPAPAPDSIGQVRAALADKARVPSAIADAFQVAAAPKGGPLASAEGPAACRLPRIIVLGLKGADRAAIEKEFKDCFDLKVYESTNALGGGFESALRNSERVVLAFGSGSVNSIKTTIRRAGANPLHVGGGMARLREALTALYVELNEKEPA